MKKNENDLLCELHENFPEVFYPGQKIISIKSLTEAVEYYKYLDNKVSSREVLFEKEYNQTGKKGKLLKLINKLWVNYGAL